MNKWAVVRLLTMAAIVLGGGWFAWDNVKNRGAEVMPIRYVRIEGAFQYIGKERVKEALQPQINLGFYNVDVQSVHETIKALPLIDRVDVMRVWPDAIHIKITEHKPVVRWGNDALLNVHGEVMTPDSMVDFQQLPLITGPVGQERKLLEIMKGIAIVLKDKAMQLTEFHVSETRSWKLKLANGMEIQLGRKVPLENLQRLLRTVDLLGAEQAAWIATVDMRYPNGYAVTWKPDTPEIDWKTIVQNKNQI